MSIDPIERLKTSYIFFKRRMMLNDLKTVIYWVRRGLRKDVFNIKPPPAQIGDMARALLDFRNMTGGGLVDLPAGIWSVDKPIPLENNIDFKGSKNQPTIITGSSSPLLEGYGSRIYISNMNFVGDGNNTLISVPLFDENKRG